MATIEEMQRALETAWAAHRTAERRISELEGDLRTERAKRGAAETLTKQAESRVRTDRAQSRIEAALTKAGANALAASDAAAQILAEGDPEYDAAGDLVAVSVKGQRAASIDKIGARALESIEWLARSAGMPGPGDTTAAARTPGELAALPTSDLAALAEAELVATEAARRDGRPAAPPKAPVVRDPRTLTPEQLAALSSEERIAMARKHGSKLRAGDLTELPRDLIVTLADEDLARKMETGT